MTSAAGQNREIEQLKTLLFQTESARLETLETDVAFLQQYVGGAERLEAATADILIAALERAEVKRPRELANAIAPSVVSAIRSEIKNSRELMIDALYPITGRLVSAAVGNAFKELVAFVEQRINALTSTELWIGRVKSLATGRPISEFVLADGNPPRINRLLILERGSGRLIADWTDGGISDERADMLSAMVAAILEFSVQAFAGEGDLQKLDFGGREIVLRASPRFILAAECTGGSLRPADDARINSLFLDTIESMDRGSNCDAAMLASKGIPPQARIRTGAESSSCSCSPLWLPSRSPGWPLASLRRRCWSDGPMRRCSNLLSSNHCWKPFRCDWTSTIAIEVSWSPASSQIKWTSFLWSTLWPRLRRHIESSIGSASCLDWSSRRRCAPISPPCSSP
jgi:hypothetical protein